MRQVALRGLLAHKGRLVATFLAVALGVAFIGGVLTLTDTMNRTFDDLFADVYGGTDAVVRSNDEISTDGFGSGPGARGTLPASVLDQVRDAPGVADVSGDVGGYAQVIDRHGDPVGNPARGAPTLGGNWSDVPALNPFTIADGRPPERAGEIVIDRATANKTGYAIGDRVRVQTRTGADEYSLTGITRFGTADSPGGATYVMWTTDEAQQVVGEPGRFSSIAAVADRGVSQPELKRAIQDHLSAEGVTGTEVLTGKQIIEETQTDIQRGLQFLTVFFGAFAVIAVFVGTFVIYNSFAIIVAQRAREMALLRAIGASRKQVRRAVLLEAVAVGLAGSVVGFLAGLGVAVGLGALLGLPKGTLAVVPTAVATAIVSGVVVTVISALVPAWRAARIPPLAAMREVSVDTTGRSRARLGIGAVLLALGVAAVVTGAVADRVPTVGLGVAGALLGLLFLSSTLARPVSGVLGRPVARLRGVSGRLAGENVGRNPRRTSATAQALMIGVGVVSFVLVINASIRATIDRSLEESFRGDLVVDSGTFGMIGMPPAVAQRIDEVPGVAVVAPIRVGQAKIGDESTFVAATNVGGVDLLGIRVLDTTPAVTDALAQPRGDLPAGTILVDQDTAASRHLSVGDRLPTGFVDDRRPTADQTMTVGGLYDSSAGISLGSYLIGLSDFGRAVPTGTDAQIVVKLDGGVPVARAQAEIERAVRPLTTADVQTVDQYRDAVGAQLDTLLALIIGLLVLTIVIAMLGIANTMALSVIERTREIGLLRAVGMSRRQLRSAIRWESVIIALFGTLLGLAVGLLGGWGMVSAIGEDGPDVFAVPVGPLIAVSVALALMATVAASFPAWRASRLDVLDAIESE